MKIEIILLLYDRLICGGRVGRNAFCAQFGISERTFYRYIRKINDFLVGTSRTTLLISAAKITNII